MSQNRENRVPSQITGELVARIQELEARNTELERENASIKQTIRDIHDRCFSVTRG